MAAGATYEPIATQTLASAAASITFSSIAASWTDLRLVFLNISTTGNNICSVRLNADSATNYSYTSIYGNGTTATSTAATSQTQIDQVSSGSNVSYPQLWTLDLFSYAGSTYKTSLATSSNDRNGSGYTERTVYLWRSTAAITSLVITSAINNMGIGTTATLYGIAKA